MSIYHEPEKFGLEVVGEASVPLGYEFDIFVVWRDKRGGYRWASDAGCSCPTPFEKYGLDNLPLGTARDALLDLKAWLYEDFATTGGTIGRLAAADGLIKTLSELL